MIVKQPATLPFFTAGDLTRLTEVLHPKNDLIDLPYSLAYATLPVGAASLPHTLSGSETYIFTAGTGVIITGDHRQEVKAGVVIMIPAEARQHVKNTGEEELCFYCIVAPAWSEAGEQIEK